MESPVALVDGIRTGLRYQEWPPSLVVNFTQDLPGDLRVDRRMVKPPQAAASAIFENVRANGAAAIAAWRAPDFLALHSVLSELPSDVTVGVDGILKTLDTESLIVDMPILNLKWPLAGAGICDLDPTIAGELCLVTGVNMYSLYAYELPMSRLVGSLSVVSDEFENSTPLKTRIPCLRASELARAGLKLLSALRHLITFETLNGPESVPAVSAPVMKAICEDGRIDLAILLRWIEA